MSKSPRIMVFRPNWDEFQNFSSYIEHMESQGAHKAGIAKVCILTNVLYLPRYSVYFLKLLKILIFNVLKNFYLGYSTA